MILSASRGPVTLGSEQEMDGAALAIDRTVEIPPLARDLQVRLVHAPTRTHRAFALTEDAEDHR